MSFSVTAAAYIDVLRIYNSSLLPHRRHWGEGVLWSRLNGTPREQSPVFLIHGHVLDLEQTLHIESQR